MNDRLTMLDRFYDFMADLEVRCADKRRLVECDGSLNWPGRGVYFFFEHGETRTNNSTSRVVRVGTHGLRPSKSTLWGRLAQHRGSVGGTNPGGGNHRGSIFRLHVGTALLASGDWPESIHATWGVGGSASAEVRAAEYPLERAVSEYIGAMPFLWLEVDDAPGPMSNRGLIERGAIGLLSNAASPAIDPPSPVWLGRHADRETIRRSGLWNVEHVNEHYDPRFLQVLAQHMVVTPPRRER
jgi:hypothetical protein